MSVVLSKRKRTKKKIYFIENNDSFSWNVIDALPFSRSEISIIPNESKDVIKSSFDNVLAVVIGPGPMDPIRTRLTDTVLFCAEKKIPTLGICLGFQAIGMAFGSKLIQTNPVHGKCSSVVFSASRFFSNFTGMVEVMRYHSLSLENVKPPLNAVAVTTDNIPMALEHNSLPIAGFQFHPDSYATKRGIEILESFFNIAL